MSDYFQIALATGLRQWFTYLPPSQQGQDAAVEPTVGARVLVPFGRSQRVGLVMAKAATSSIVDSKLKPILSVLDKHPLLPAPIWQLGMWACDYYQHPVGDGMLHLLPVNLRQGHENTLLSRHWQCSSGDIKNDAGIPVGLKRSRKQSQAWFTLQQLPAVFSILQLEAAGLKASDIKPLLNKGHVAPCEPQTVHVKSLINQSPLPLNDEQQRAFDQVNADLNSFACYLLDGITGSGKTEIYLQLITRCLETGKRALVLVPEIGLTHQLVERLQARFNNALLVLHSGLTNRQRHSAWQLSGLGQGEIILGTRSAVFTPIPDLGLIIVDEEHDQAFKQQEGFRYHGRDVAIKRAAQANIPIVLGSATPSLESLANARRKRYQHLRLRERAGGASAQKYEVIDMRNQSIQNGLSEHLQMLMTEQLALGQQVLLMLNRRGFSPCLQCHQCGQAVTCPACDARMTLHKAPARMHCHHCDHREAVPVTCHHCHGQPMLPVGSGTERLEEHLQETFNEYPIYRIDRDTTRNKGSLQTMLEAIQQGKPCLLLGTQMLAKGHHFPHVTMAAIVDADSSLFSGDFRGVERLSQLFIQTAGRAGREKMPGIAYVQTYQADHPIITTLTQFGYEAFADQELTYRQQNQLPPYGYMALFLVQSRHEQKAYGLLYWLQQQLCGQDILEAVAHLRYFGPMPAMLARRANMYRVQLQLQHTSRRHLQVVCRYLCGLLEDHPDSKKLRWSLDIDPQDLG